MKRFVQFIAGAVCPKCKQIDTIAINKQNDQIYCVKCDFKDNRPIEATNTSQSEIKVVNIEDYKNK